jgi:chemotaxis protein CheC
MSSPHLLATQILNGELSGENLFLIDKVSAIKMATQFDLAEENMEDEELEDVVLEITNILSSSIISSLASEMGANASFSPPSLKYINSEDNINDDFQKQYNKVIIISTKLSFEAHDINATIIMLTTDKSITYIKNVINKILEEF